MTAISPIISLGDFTVTTAATQTFDPVTGLAGMDAVTLSARLAYGSGGTSVSVLVQTSLDQGQTWVDIARFDFTTTGTQKIVNLSGLTPRTTPLTVAPLGAEGANDGVLGDRLRASITSVGTYAGSTMVSVRAMPR